MAPVATAVEAATSVVVQKFDDWYYRCAPSGLQSRSCEIAQVAQVMREEKSVNVLTLAIAPVPETTPKGSKKAARSLILTALLPLNVALQAGLSIAAEGKPVARLAYRNCNQAGCWAELPLEPAMLAALSKGTTGEASLRLMDGQDIKIRFSLKGLKAALSALQGQASK
ncbi:invasion associated locus B family protein [Rhizobium sp. R693]|uniref:invasion associated locus B family protein n=1 Tax=Rhizobium sp. R693 TaxID=1764276 RepID=UPI000B67D5F1|nr:invasion associated locus B family protein [Rhizobium sp. R693]OWV99183.1 invasion protein B [Rhizobium sp. R693]